MTSHELLRGLWVAVAGAVIAFGAGHGVAAAESDSTGGGAGSSSAQSSSSSQPSADEAQVVPKDSDGGQGLVGRSKGVEKPATTVRASTVTTERNGPATSDPVEQVKSAPAKSSTRADPATPIAPPAVQAEADGASRPPRQSPRHPSWRSRNF